MKPIYRVDVNLEFPIMVVAADRDEAEDIARAEWEEELDNHDLKGIVDFTGITELTSTTFIPDGWKGGFLYGTEEDEIIEKYLEKYLEYIEEKKNPDRVLPNQERLFKDD